MMYKSRTSLFAILLVGALGLIFLTTGMAYATCPKGMISYWKLDEATPAAAGGTYDDFFNGNDGTGTANPSATTGQVNGAQLFDGATTGVNVAADRSFDWYSDESFSIEYWMKRDSTGFSGTEVLVGRLEGGGVQWWVGVWGTNSSGKTPTRAGFVLIATNGDGAANAELLAGDTTDLTDGDWHHIVAVRDGTDNILYVDGTEEARVTISYGAGFGSASAPLNLGNIGGSFYYGGALDEVAIYDKALTSTEIQKHYNDGLAGKGIDYVAPGNGDGSDSDGGGGGGGGGCFIATVTD